MINLLKTIIFTSTNKVLSKSTILKQKTVTYTKTKFIVTKKYIEYVANDPVYQGVAITIGIVSGTVSILSFGHQLYSGPSIILSEEQLKSILEKARAEQAEDLKLMIETEVNQKFETQDMDLRKELETQKQRTLSLTQQNSALSVVLFAVVLFATFGNTKGFEILAEHITLEPNTSIFPYIDTFTTSGVNYTSEVINLGLQHI